MSSRTSEPKSADSAELDETARETCKSRCWVCRGTRKGEEHQKHCFLAHVASGPATHGVQALSGFLVLGVWLPRPPKLCEMQERPQHPCTVTTITFLYYYLFYFFYCVYYCYYCILLPQNVCPNSKFPGFGCHQNAFSHVASLSAT